MMALIQVTTTQEASSHIANDGILCFYAGHEHTAPSLIHFVLKKVGGSRVDPRGSPRLKTPRAITAPISVVSSSLFDFPV